jgi:hypothetical protein
VLRELGYRAVLVLLREDKQLKAVKDFVDDQCVVWSGADWSVFSQAMPFFGVTQNMRGFVDGRITGELRSMAEGMGFQTLIGTKGLRHTFPGWTLATQRVEHSLVGGVPTHTATLTALTCRAGTLCRSTLPYVLVGRDAGTVLSIQPFVSTFRAIPGALGGDSLRSVNLGMASHPYYHGGGLLPGVLDKRLQVLAPVLCAPKGLWGLRHLTSSEILVAKDFSPGAVDKLWSDSITNDFLQDLVPGKCLMFGFRSLINEGGMGTEAETVGITGFESAYAPATTSESEKRAGSGATNGATGGSIRTMGGATSEISTTETTRQRGNE